MSPFRSIACGAILVASLAATSGLRSAVAAQSVTVENSLADHYAHDPFPQACPRGAQIADMPAGRRIERPHWVYNDGTGRWVLWAHYEAKGYGTAEAMVATAPNECGPYTIVRTFRPLGHEVRDDFLYKDTDGAAYFIAASRESGGANDSMAIFRLTPDYTDVDASAGVHWVFEHQYREAPVVLKKAGVYFLLTSQAAGWFPSQAAYATSTSMLGPWSRPTDLGNTSTFGGQNADVRTFGGEDGARILILDHLGGQKGRDDGALRLPVKLDPLRRTARLDWYSRYAVNLRTGALDLPVQTDLAADQPATASSSAPKNPPSMANDADYRSEWAASSPTFPAWWMVDLGPNRRIGEVDISWWMQKGSEAAYGYTIDTSQDGVHFASLDRRNNSFYGFTADKLNVRARYVRVTLTGATMASGKPNWYTPRILDVRVFSMDE